MQAVREALGMDAAVCRGIRHGCRLYVCIRHKAWMQAVCVRGIRHGCRLCERH